ARARRTLRRSMTRRLVLLFTAALTAAASRPAIAHDAGVAGQRVVASVAGGKQQLRSTQKDPAIEFGPGSAASELSGAFQLYYVDSPSNRATLALPAPWLANTGVLASFSNRLAPAGPTAVRSARVQRGKLADLNAKGVGGLDLSSPPGAGGVATIFTIQNAGDGSTHRLCTLYRAASGSTVQHKRTATGNKLTLRKGVAMACPTCADGIRNDRETGVDCGGGACAACGVGQGCHEASDCATGVCTAGVCQATCDDEARDGSETDVDCGGGACPACAPGQACLVASDCSSGVCTGGVCRTPTCGDGVRNASETDVDCGGPTCPPCVPFTVVLDSPAHGAFSTATSVPISGHATGVGPAGADLTINGAPVTLAPDGAFTATLPLDAGLVFNPVNARLVRHFDGLTAYDRRVVVAGASIARGGRAPNGVALRLADRGLDAVEPFATTLVDIDPATLVTPGTTVLGDYCYASLGSL